MSRRPNRIAKPPIALTREPEQDHVASGSIIPFDIEAPRKVSRDPLLLRTDVVARLLNISQRKVQKMFKSGELPCRPVVRLLRIPKWAVLRYAGLEDL